MGTLISVLIIAVSILLILVVLVQNSKGGGLASSFAASNQVMGVKKTADFLEKATWTLAILLLVLSLASSPYTSGNGGATSTEQNESVTRKKAEEQPVVPVAPPAGASPGIPTPQPQQAPQPEGQQ